MLHYVNYEYSEHENLQNFIESERKKSSIKTKNSPSICEVIEFELLGRERRETCDNIYPLEVKTGRRIEQATSTDVIPAAVPSTVFSDKTIRCSNPSAR